MRTFLRLTILVAGVSLAFAACDTVNLSDEQRVGAAGPPEDNIAPLTLSYRTAETGADTVRITSTTGMAPDTMFLAVGGTYFGTVSFDREGMFNQIRNEAESHLFAYSFSSGVPDTSLNLTDRESLYTTRDLNGGEFPLGLTFTAVVDTAAAGEATMRLRLSHFEGAPKSGANDQGGSADADVQVPVVFF